MLDELHPMELSEAATILRCDTHPLAVSRRRRAIAKLAAFGWQDNQIGRFHRELDILGLDRPRFTRLARERLEHPESPPSIRESPWPHQWLVEWLFARLLSDEPRLFADSASDPCDARPEAPYDPDPLIDDTGTEVTIDTYVSVALAKTQVTENIDPQRWDECSKLWPESYGTPPQQGTYVATVSKTLCTVTGVAPDLSPPTPGTAYPAPKPLFEHFECLVSPCSAWFENVLTVDVQSLNGHTVFPGTPYQKSVASHHVTYDLPVCDPDPYNGYLQGEIATQPVIVLVDRGSLDAWEETQNGVARTHVLAHKAVQFSPHAWNTAAGISLTYAELNQELAELACCLGSGP